MKFTILLKLCLFSAVGAFCKLNQDVTSWNHTEGAAVAIDAFEYERERDDCPMYFDDGIDPWKPSDASNIVFDWDIYRDSAFSLWSTFTFELICFMSSLALFSNWFAL